MGVENPSGVITPPYECDSKLKVLYDPTESVQPAVDIFFVSGLLAPARSTSSAWETPQFFWPHELGGDIANARIISWEFSPEEDGHGADSIDVLGGRLLAAIDSFKIGSEESQRPSIFVAHSLGGLIVKSALLQSKDVDLSVVLNTTKGLCFFGTPQAWSRETWRHAISEVRRVLVSQRPDLVSHSPLTADTIENEKMRLESRDFRRLINQLSIPVLSFYETQDTPTNRGNIMVVSEEIAQLRTANEQVFKRRGNHLDLVKFSSRDDRDYRRICQFIANLVPESVIPRRHGTSIGQLTLSTVLEAKSLQNLGKEKQFLKKLRFDWLEEDMIADSDPGTCAWLENGTEWKKWDSQKTEPLYVFGEPGMGKTVLAKFILQRARRQQHHEPNAHSKHIIGYFFDERMKMRSDFNGLLRALLYYLLFNDGELFRHVRGKEIFSSPSFDSISLSTACLLEILSTILEDPSLGQVMILLEAVDECEESSRPDMVNLISKVRANADIKLVITGRSLPWLLSETSISIDLNSNRNSPTSSVQVYIKKEVQRVLGHAFPNNFTHDLESVLLKRSSPSFLWVRLAVRYVERQRTTLLSRRAMESLPSVSEVSALFLKYLHTEFLFDKIPLLSVYIVMEAKAPLTLSGLSYLSAAAFGEQSPHNTLGDSKLSTILESTIRGFEEEIISIPFLQIREDNVSLMHGNLSQILKQANIFQDLLTLFTRNGTSQNDKPGLMTMISASARRGLNPLLRTVHYMIAELCLTYLLASLREDRDPLNFLSYAALYWFEHIQSAHEYPADSEDGHTKKEDGLPKTLVDLICKFLSSEAVCNESPTKSQGSKCTVFAKWMRQYKKYDISHTKRMLPDEGLTQYIPAFTFAAFDLYWVLGDHIDHGGKEMLVVEDDHYTPLHFIVANNSFRSLEWIKNRWFPNHSSSEDLQSLALEKSSRQKNCPVVMAVEFGNKEMVDLFIDLMAGASVQARRFLGHQHSLASKFGHKEIFLTLYNKGFTDLLPEEEQQAVMESAAALDCVEVVNKIFEKHKMEKASLVIVLHSAIRAYAEKTTEHLIESADTKDINMSWVKGRTALHEAADIGNERFVGLLLSHGAIPNAFDKARQTPLHLGSNGGFLGVCNILLEQGARVNLADSDGCVAVHCAAQNGHDPVLKRLLKAGSNVFASNKKGQLPLHLACEAARESTVKLLLDENARAGARDSKGRTPLHYAAESGNVRIVWLLVDAGANMYQDDGGVMPLHLAARKSSDVMVKALLNQGANPLAEDKDHKTAVHYCLESNKPSQTIFRALMESVDKIELSLPHNSLWQTWLDEYPEKIERLDSLSKRATDEFLLGQDEMDDTSDQDLADSMALERDLDALVISEGQQSLEDLD